MEKVVSNLENRETPRRSTRNSVLPGHLNDFIMLALSAEAYVDSVPQTYEEAEERPDRKNWKEAIEQEMKSLIENDTWEIADLPPGARAIDGKWVFKLKRKADGSIEKYKARMVAKGCAQKKGLDYEETYASVAPLTTLRTLLAAINEHQLDTHQLDVKNAFLHGNLKEEIFIKIPPGFSEQKGKVLRLKKALYGLKQAPKAWKKTFDNFAKEIGFVQSKADRCLYVDKCGEEIFLLLYVDDIILAGKNGKRLLFIKEKLENKFKMNE